MDNMYEPKGRIVVADNGVKFLVFDNQAVQIKEEQPEFVKPGGLAGPVDPARTQPLLLTELPYQMHWPALRAQIEAERAEALRIAQQPIVQQPIVQQCIIHGNEQVGPSHHDTVLDLLAEQRDMEQRFEDDAARLSDESDDENKPRENKSKSPLQPPVVHEEQKQVKRKGNRKPRIVPPEHIVIRLPQKPDYSAVAKKDMDEKVVPTTVTKQLPKAHEPKARANKIKVPQGKVYYMEMLHSFYSNNVQQLKADLIRIGAEARGSVEGCGIVEFVDHNNDEDILFVRVADCPYKPATKIQDIQRVKEALDELRRRAQPEADELVKIRVRHSLFVGDPVALQKKAIMGGFNRGGTIRDCSGITYFPDNKEGKHEYLYVIVRDVSVLWSQVDTEKKRIEKDIEKVLGAANKLNVTFHTFYTEDPDMLLGKLMKNRCHEEGTINGCGKLHFKPEIIDGQGQLDITVHEPKIDRDSIVKQLNKLCIKYRASSQKK